LTLLDCLGHVKTQVRVVRQLDSCLPHSNRRSMGQARLGIAQQDRIYAFALEEPVDVVTPRPDVHQYRPDRPDGDRDSARMPLHLGMAVSVNVYV
jgi:hypothetical protein